MAVHIPHIPCKRALLIGINYVGSTCELSGCVNDAENVGKMLQNRGFQTRFLLDSNATRARIIAEMIKIVAKTRAGDTLYVHYSGHGCQVPDENGDERDGFDECICPVDMDTNGVITDDLLNKILVQVLPIGAKLRCVFDSCHSGSALDLPLREDNTGRIQRENTDDLSVDAAAHGRDIIFISGCRDSQTSADATINKAETGALTWAFLQCLPTHNDHNDYAPHSSHTWTELIQKMCAKLCAEGFSQVPQISSWTETSLKSKCDL